MRSLTPAAEPLIADRGEFLDVLALMRRGHLLVEQGDERVGVRCAVSGWVVWHSLAPLKDYGLLDPVPTPDAPRHTRCWRLSPRGLQFADRAWQAWRRQPLWRRLAVRFTG